jgi:copper chaperone
MTEVALRVGMTCEGCSAAVQRVLEKLDGVKSVDISLEQQKVVVKGDVTPEAVKDQVAKTGKPTEYWS